MRSTFEEWQRIQLRRNATGVLSVHQIGVCRGDRRLRGQFRRWFGFKHLTRTNSGTNQHPQGASDLEIGPSITETVSDNAGPDGKKKPKPKTSKERILRSLEETISHGKHLLKHKQNDYQPDNAGLHHDLDVPVMRVSQIVHVI